MDSPLFNWPSYTHGCDAARPTNQHLDQMLADAQQQVIAGENTDQIRIPDIVLSAFSQRSAEEAASHAHDLDPLVQRTVMKQKQGNTQEAIQAMRAERISVVAQIEGEGRSLAQAISEALTESCSFEDKVRIHSTIQVHTIAKIIQANKFYDRMAPRIPLGSEFGKRESREMMQHEDGRPLNNPMVGNVMTDVSPSLLQQSWKPQPGHQAQPPLVPFLRNFAQSTSNDQERGPFQNIPKLNTYQNTMTIHKSLGGQPMARSTERNISNMESLGESPSDSDSGDDIIGPSQVMAGRSDQWQERGFQTGLGGTFSTMPGHQQKAVSMDYQDSRKKGNHQDQENPGYYKVYVQSEKTGRPNQVFICSTCNVSRPKRTKILKHMNVHREKKQPSTDLNRQQIQVMETDQQQYEPQMSFNQHHQ